MEIIRYKNLKLEHFFEIIDTDGIEKIEIELINQVIEFSYIIHKIEKIDELPKQVLQHYVDEAYINDYEVKDTLTIKLR